jgi:hypothetical protein
MPLEKPKRGKLVREGDFIVSWNHRKNLQQTLFITNKHTDLSRKLCPYSHKKQCQYAPQNLCPNFCIVVWHNSIDLCVVQIILSCTDMEYHIFSATNSPWNSFLLNSSISVLTFYYTTCVKIVPNFMYLMLYIFN